MSSYDLLFNHVPIRAVAHWFERIACERGQRYCSQNNIIPNNKLLNYLLLLLGHYKFYKVIGKYNIIPILGHF